MMLGNTFYSSQPQPQAHVQAGFDVAAVSIAGATIMGWLPNIAAVLSVVYLCLQIATSIRNWRRQRSRPSTYYKEAQED